MSSFLSFIASNFTAFDLYHKLFTNAEFSKLMNNFSSRGEMQTALHDLLKNMLFKRYDEDFQELMQSNKELDKIFSNNDITKKSQVKLCLGKIGNYLFDQYVEDNVLSGLVKFDREACISIWCSLPDWFGVRVDNINSVKELYSELIDCISYDFSNVISSNIRDTTYHSSTGFDNSVDLIEEIVKQVNEFYDYKSPNYSKKRPRQDDTTDDTTDSDTKEPSSKKQKK